MPPTTASGMPAARQRGRSSDQLSGRVLMSWHAFGNQATGYAGTPTTLVSFSCFLRRSMRSPRWSLMMGSTMVVGSS